MEILKYNTRKHGRYSALYVFFVLCCRHFATFCKDVVLLLSPLDNVVPRQAAKLRLHNKKHIIQAVDVPKDLGREELLEFLSSLFVNKLNGRT